jgi:uncharacterized protein (TIGR00251 family)
MAVRGQAGGDSDRAGNSAEAVIPPELLERLRRDGRVVVTLKVIPKASKNEIAGILEDGSLRVKVTAAPEKGRANAALCEFLAQQFGVSRRGVTLLRGETSHNKQVEIRL